MLLVMAIHVRSWITSSSSNNALHAKQVHLTPVPLGVLRFDHRWYHDQQRFNTSDFETVGWESFSRVLDYVRSTYKYQLHQLQISTNRIKYVAFHSGSNRQLRDRCSIAQLNLHTDNLVMATHLAPRHCIGASAEASPKQKPEATHGGSTGSITLDSKKTTSRCKLISASKKTSILLVLFCCKGYFFPIGRWPPRHWNHLQRWPRTSRRRPLASPKQHQWHAAAVLLLAEQFKTQRQWLVILEHRLEYLDIVRYYVLAKMDTIPGFDCPERRLLYLGHKSLATQLVAYLSSKR